MVRIISRTPDRNELRTISPLAPRGTNPCAPPTTFARPAHPLLVRFFLSTGAGGVTVVGEGTEYTFFQWVRVVRLGPGPDPRSF